MHPQEVVQEAWAAARCFLFGLLVAGVVAFGAGYFTGVKKERARIFRQIQKTLEEYDAANDPKIEQEFHWQKLRI